MAIGFVAVVPRAVATPAKPSDEAYVAPLILPVAPSNVNVCLWIAPPHVPSTQPVMSTARNASLPCHEPVCTAPPKTLGFRKSTVGHATTAYSALKRIE